MRGHHTATVNGVAYPIVYNLAAIENLENAFGDLQAALDATGVGAAIKVFEALAKAYEETAFDPDVPYPALPSEMAYKSMLAGDFRRLKDDCGRCIAEDMAVEVEADPPEAAEKNGKPSRAKRRPRTA